MQNWLLKLAGDGLRVLQETGPFSSVVLLRDGPLFNWQVQVIYSSGRNIIRQLDIKLSMQIKTGVLIKRWEDWWYDTVLF